DVVVPPPSSIDPDPGERLGLLVEEELEFVAPAVDSSHNFPRANTCVLHCFFADGVIDNNDVRVHPCDSSSNSDGEKSWLRTLSSANESCGARAPRDFFEVRRDDFGEEGSEEVIGLEVALDGCEE